MPKLPRAARLPLAAVLLLSASSIALSQNPAPNASAPQQQPVISDDSIDDFADLNKNLNNLREKIAKAKEVVAKNEDPNAPANQRAAFHKLVDELLVGFADDGEIAKLGETAIEFVNARLSEAQKETSFPPDQREALMTRWRRIAMQTQTAVATLDATRKDLQDKLKLLQSKADFVDQMEKLKQARTTLDAIGDLADQRQSVSERIKSLLQGKPAESDDDTD
jgi:hypothetical protein